MVICGDHFRNRAAEPGFEAHHRFLEHLLIKLVADWSSDRTNGTTHAGETN